MALINTRFAGLFFFGIFIFYLNKFIKYVEKFLQKFWKKGGRKFFFLGASVTRNREMTQKCPPHLKGLECEIWEAKQKLKKVGPLKRKTVTYSNLTTRQLINLLVYVNTPRSVKNNVVKEMIKRRD
jgi:hypothetical protein